MLCFRAILHPTDFSEAADDAYRMARLIARACGGRLIVLHVVGLDLNLPHPAHTELGFTPDGPGDDQSRYTAWRHRHAQVETDHDLRVETRLIYGDPAAEIVRVAEEVPCDLIVMGTHGRSGLSRLLMGSVAGAVLGRAPCLVLTVKSPTSKPSCGSDEGAPRGEPAGCGSESNGAQPRIRAECFTSEESSFPYRRKP